MKTNKKDGQVHGLMMNGLSMWATVFSGLKHIESEAKHPSRDRVSIHNREDGITTLSHLEKMNITSVVSYRDTSLQRKLKGIP
jgi:hypothetical protein